MKRSVDYSDYILKAEQREFIRLLEMMVLSLRDLEEAKKELTGRRDFLAREIFAILTDFQEDSVRKGDLKFALESLKIDFNDEDIDFLMISFDLDEDGVLNYSEFCEMILPHSKKSRSKLLKRRATEIESIEDYSIKTRKWLREVFMRLVNIEEFVTKESKLIQDNLDTLIAKISEDNNGKTVDIDDVADSLAEAGVDLTFRELNEVLDRFGM